MPTRRCPRNLRAKCSDACRSSCNRDCAGAILRRQTWYMGAPMRWYRPMVGERLGRLYHRGRARWTDVRVHESLRFDGPTETFRAPFIHLNNPDARAQAAQDAALRGAEGARLARAQQAGAHVDDAVRVPRGVSQGLLPAAGVSGRLARLRRRAGRGLLRGVQAHALLRDAAQSAVARAGGGHCSAVTASIRPRRTFPSRERDHLEQALPAVRFGAIRTRDSASVAGRDSRTRT